MDGREEGNHFNIFGDGEMDIPLAHLNKFMESPGKAVEIWLEKVKKDMLTPIYFKDHWKIWVPKFYALEPGSDWNLENDKEQDELIENLERFIANGNFNDAMQKLDCLDHPQSMCGKVFKAAGILSKLVKARERKAREQEKERSHRKKEMTDWWERRREMGEPSYSCRECGMDATCVLCVECFRNSAHKNHNYKIGHSPGGGFCDCGDEEAWKKEPFCDIHFMGTQVKSDSLKFPEDMAKRCRLTFTAVLKYAYQVLTLEHSPGLPHDLRFKGVGKDPFFEYPDIYCTVLYNDEIHTYEQVITTLTKVVKCSQKDAVEYVTNIDREGRAVVKCSTFQQCQELKTEIERFTMKHGNPLKVEVVHTYVIAHQIFAMKLLRWLRAILPKSENFRSIFSNIALTPTPPDCSIVEGILLKDSRLWKSARTHWHRIFITGMLMEYSSKKALAIVFTKHYGSVMKDFINDDHDHSFSVASLSVQLFTTPTLSHHLIAKEEVLFILFHTFMSECMRKLNKNGKLQFERNSGNQNFKRSYYILGDLQYLLGSKPTPEQWTDPLRIAFLQGLSTFLQLLGCMQGMEAVTRQVVQHTEFEPEWEAAFHLHNKLSPVISLIIDWCGSDKIVLIKAFRTILSKIQCQIEECQTIAVRTVTDHAAACIQYDVATKPVSIHLQVSRFLAGLYLHLGKYNLSFDSPEFQSSSNPCPDQIIEPVLRTQVMIAQVHSGMWRRNGYSLLNQVFSYHSVQYRSEMLDRDIVILQIGASLIQGDEFLILLLNKFNLIDWADPGFEENTFKNPEEDLVLQTISLVEQFLGLVIAIVGERYVPGVGKVTSDDQIKKEIIQQLCIRPMSHSELNKTLPKDLYHETGLDNVIDDVAQFKKPCRTTGMGLYELKPEFYDQYNIYSYHYTREELSKSEEEQRKRREHANELVCCPPPKLPQLTEAFFMIPNLLQCDVMLHIMQTVLKRSNNLRARSFSENQLQKILHLIGYALQEEESKYYPYLVFTEKSKKWNIKKLLKDLVTSPRVEALKDMLTWTLNKFKEVEAAKGNADASTASSFTVDTPTPVNDGKEWRAKMAAEKRAKIMAHMTMMQKNFMKENAKLFEETVTYPEKATEYTAMDLCEEGDRDPVALGPNQTSRLLVEKTFTCILCQEDSTVTANGPALVLSAFIQKSTVHAYNRSKMQKPDEVLTKPLFLPTCLRPQPHTSTCSHVMHSVCWQKYFDNVMAKENRRPYRLRTPLSFDIERQEFLCPLCECLSNTVLPLLPPLGMMKPKMVPSVIPFERFIDGLELTLRFNVWPLMKEEDEEKEVEVASSCCIEKVVQELGEPYGAAFAGLFPEEERPQLSQSLVDMILLFAQATYTKGLSVNPSFNASVPLMAWNSCYYTVYSIERLLVDQEKPLFGMLSSRQKDCLEGMTRVAGVLGAIWKNGKHISNHILFLLSMLLDGNSKTKELPCILDWDSFGLLVPLTLSLPNLFSTKQTGALPGGGLLELYTLRLVFMSHVTRLLLITKFQSGEADMETDDTDGPTLTASESELLLDVLSNIKKCCNYDMMEVKELDANYVWATVKMLSVPFLRSCALFYNFLTDVPYPSCLTEPGGDTYESFVKYLGLPLSVQELFDTPRFKTLSTSWVSHERVPGYLASQSFVKEPRPVNGLVPLPPDYSELINTIATFTCPNSEKEDARYPTMCLVCGEILCSQSYCCQRELENTSVGACTYHAYHCGANSGIFLRIRDCEVLLLATTSRGCFRQAPYLDRYGETDPGLRRGNPLTLCPMRYQKLRYMWLSHGLHEEITRAIESNTNVITTQWQHL